MANLFIFVGCLLFPFSILAHPFWENHSEGWHWYHDPKQEKTTDEDISSTQDPIEQMNELQMEVKRSLDKAVLFPTETNIKNYIALQNRIAAQASTFSKQWRQALLNTPTLDYSLTYPTNNIGKQAYIDAQHQHQEKAFRELAKTTGFFFFFRESCPYCHRFSPLVKAFSKRYGFSVIPISLDGGTLPEFPEIKSNNGIADKFHVTRVPALFAVNPHTQQVIPLTYGLISEEELTQRLYALTQENTQ